VYESNQMRARDAKLGGTGAVTLVLHTWTQELRRHVHVHALMACGALGVDAQGAATWIEPKRARNFLFPVHALSKVFKGKFMQGLQDAERAGVLAREPAVDAAQRRERRKALQQHDWVVYAKTPLAGPAQVLDYLSRYTHRTAVSNERLVGIAGNNVLLRVRADDGGGGQRVIAIDGEQFIGRFLQHVLPPGFKRIRHYGLLAPAAKTARLAAARALLAMPQANPQAREDAQAFIRRVAAIEIERCPHCAQGRWCIVEQHSAERTAIAKLMPPGYIGSMGCRGPP
jgi:Putative transposase